MNPLPDPDQLVPMPPSQDECHWAMAAHLSALLTALLSSGWLGLGALLGPLILWLWKKDGSAPFVADQALEALNFNLTVLLLGMVLLAFSMVTLGLGILIVAPLGVLLGIVWLIFVLLAAVKASQGQRYRYPYILRLIK